MAELLTLGSVDDHPDYVALHGFQPEHVPELIQMAIDPELNGGDGDEVWAPMHAWRVLGDLRAAEAAEPLAQFLATLDDDYAGDLGLSIARIGAPAYPHLLALLRDTARASGARAVAAEALAYLATVEPTLRGECVAVLTEILASEPDHEVVDLAADGLLDLGAVESAPAFRRALEDGRFHESVCGDWEDVQIEMGLLEERTTPRPPPLLEEMIFQEYTSSPETAAQIQALFGDPALLAEELAQMGPWDRRRPVHRVETAAAKLSPPGGKRSGASAAARRKMAKASRKQNRRRK